MAFAQKRATMTSRFDPVSMHSLPSSIVSKEIIYALFFIGKMFKTTGMIGR